MIQKYILLDEKEKKAISEYKPENAQFRLLSVENGKCWCVEYSADGNDEKIAKMLSGIDEYIRSHFNVIVIENDSSSYFNNNLYPMVSELERKLRKILYIYSALDKENESTKNITALEEKDFGQIFTMLFVDDNFMTAAKNMVKSANREAFSKAEIMRLLDGIEEKPVWDLLLGNDVVPTLRSRFQDVRTIRNDVMHSHDISWHRFDEARTLIQTIVSEIDYALDNVSIAEFIEKKRPTFNQTLAEALRIQEQLSQIASAILPNTHAINEVASAISEVYSDTSNLAKLSEQARKMTAAFQLSPETMKMIGQTQKISKMFRNNPVLIEAQKHAALIQNYYNSNPSILEMQRSANVLNQMLQQGYLATSKPDYIGENDNGGS